MMQGDRYKIIIGMDLLKNYAGNMDFSTEILRLKLKNGNKVNLKLTSRQTVFKTKQVQAYRKYLRSMPAA
jgi:hypothetical protein